MNSTQNKVDMKDTKSAEEIACDCGQMSEADIKIACDELMSRGERFKSFDDNFFPLEIENMDSSYHYILQKLTRKCHSAVKYHHLCDKYHGEMKHEMDEIQRICKEIKRLEHAYQHAFKMAQKPLTYIANYKAQQIEAMCALHDAPRDVMLAFSAFLNLGPQGTQGGADLSWTVMKNLLKNQTELAKAMHHMVEQRIRDVSKAEMEKAEECMRHYNHEYSSKDNNTSQMVARAMAAFVMCCLSLWDMHTSIQSRHELIMSKREKYNCMKKELATYKEIGTIFEKEVDEAIQKFQKARENYDFMVKEQEKADKAMNRFETHLQEMEKERTSDMKDILKMDQLLKELEKDCDEFDNIRVKVFYKAPVDVQIP